MLSPIFEYISNNSVISGTEKIKFNASTIENFLSKKKEIQEYNKRHGNLFNALSLFPISEIMHSHLLKTLLDPKLNHGQGYLFLKFFLRRLGIELDEKRENWVVTAEKGRVDILIKRQHPRTVVIVENKSNYASDQPSQLYRYWYQEIYLPSIQRNRPLEDTPKENYQIIYLTPDQHKIPSEYSLKRPIGFDDSLPDIIPIEPKVWLFSDQIIEWLKDSLEEIHPENYRLRVYIEQYIELWI